MDINLRHIKHLASTACIDVQHLCQPLFKLGIHLFMYMRIHTDAKNIVLASDPNWYQFYLTNFYRRRYPNSIKFVSEARGNIFISRELYPELQEVADAAEFYDFGNAICLAKQLANYKELCYFAANKQNISIINYYLNNTEYLEYFISTFKVKAANIIESAEKTKLHLPREYLSLLNNSQKPADYQKLNEQLLENVKSNKIILCHEKDEVHLTKQQITIAQWLIHGKSAEEISIILKISRRTVEEHINNLKEKLKCYKITQLVYKLGKLNIPLF